MAEALYGSISRLCIHYGGYGHHGGVGSTSSDGGDVDSDYAAAAKYRAQAHAELYGTGGLGYDPRPTSSSNASSGNNKPHAWLGWDHHPHSHQNQHHQQIRPEAFPKQHPHQQQQHPGSQRIMSQPVDLSSAAALGMNSGWRGSWMLELVVLPVAVLVVGKMMRCEDDAGGVPSEVWWWRE